MEFEIAMGLRHMDWIVDGSVDDVQDEDQQLQREDFLGDNIPLQPVKKLQLPPLAMIIDTGEH